MTRDIAVTGGTLIDGNGGDPLENATVLVRDGRITRVGRADEVEVSDAVETIDARGAWVLPGIMNGNVHLLDGIMMMGVGGVEYLARHEGNLVGVIEEAAQVALKAGMTTVFDTWNATGPILAARDRVASGEAPGARIFAAGNIIGMGGPFSADFNLRARESISRTFADRLDDLFASGVGAELSLLPANELRPLIRDYLARGVDMLKIAVSDHLVTTVGTQRGYLTFSERALRVMVEEARSAGVPVLAHSMSVEALCLSVDIEADVVIHATLTGQQPIPNELIERIIDAGTVCGVQSVMDAYQQRLEAIAHPMADYGGGVHAENERRLIAAGVPIMLTTDAGCASHDALSDSHDVGNPQRPWTLGTDHVAWAQAIVEKGMRPMDALLACTRGPAAAYRKLDELGTIEEGKIADLLVIGSDPLADVSALGDVVSVIQAGQEVECEALPVHPLVSVPIPSDPR